MSDPPTALVVPLSASTKRAELERFRAFLRYCADRQWIRSNHAAKIKFKSKIEKKFGMEPADEKLVFESIQFVEDGRVLHLRHPEVVSGFRAQEVLQKVQDLPVTEIVPSALLLLQKQEMIACVIGSAASLFSRP